MVETLKELKKQGEKVRFQGIHLFANGKYVPPPRPVYEKLRGLSEDPTKVTTPRSYQTDSDEFNTPEKQRQCDLPCEEISSDLEEEAPEWAKRMLSSMDEYLENITEDRSLLSSVSTFNDDN